MYPFSISLYEHVPKISYDKKAEGNNKNIFANKHILILKIIYTDIDLCINTSILTYVQIRVFRNE